jgi:hypothetical protein
VSQSGRKGGSGEKGRGGGKGEEMAQTLYAHMNKRKKKPAGILMDSTLIFRLK